MWFIEMFTTHKQKIEEAKNLLSDAVRNSTDANNNVINSGRKLRQSLAESGNNQLKKLIRDLG